MADYSFMNQYNGAPNWETEDILSERLRVLQDFFTKTSGLLVRQVMNIHWAIPLRTKQQTESAWEEFNTTVDNHLTAAARDLRDLSIDSGNNLQVFHPQDNNKYGKLCGLTFSMEEYAYVGSVKMGSDTKQWPILKGWQLFIGQTPPDLSGKSFNFRGRMETVDLLRSTNSVVLQYGNNSQPHAAYTLPHDGFSGSW